MRRGRPLVTDGASFVPHYLDANAVPADAALVPLDAGGDDAYRLYEIEPGEPEEAALARLGVTANGARFADVMMQLGRFPEPERERVLRAIALSQWSHKHRFCPQCGSPLHWDADDRTKTCSNDATPHRQFARTDPATIVLVRDGDRALLGRQASWPPGMYSTLAGFVEPGETAEAGVAREVFEETGVRIDDVAYVASESWPFPRSLMLGFTARALTRDIAIGDEMDDVRWFTRDEVAQMQARVRERLPYFDTIARRLIADWLSAAS